MDVSEAPKEAMDSAVIYSMWGEHPHAVDAKGRLIMPQEFREQLGEEFVIVRAPEHCLFAYPMPLWNRIMEKVDGNALDPDRMFLWEMMVSSQVRARLDGNGRLALTRTMREWAGLTESQPAMITGRGKYLELMHKNAWQKRLESYTRPRFNEAIRAAGVSV